MNTFFNWSKVYSVTHAQGRYLIFTIEYGKKNYTGVILPEGMDDIWYVAGSRLMEKMNTDEPAESDEEVLKRLNSWMAQNLNGKFVIEPVEGMYPPLELEMDV